MLHPPADIDITVADVDRLLAAQHPALRAPLRRVAHGWDNDVFRLGGDLAVRMPRREAAAQLIEHEQRWLPELAARVPVPIPVPVAVGVADAQYPWRWSVVPWFAGRRGLDLELRERDGLAAELAAVLRAVHTPAPVDAPHNPVRGVPMAERDGVVRDRLADLPGLVPIWEAGLRARPWRGPAVWLHGDVYPGNFIVDGDRIAALIDFGDLCAGDPASDLSVAWLAFTAAGRATFRTALADLYDEADWTRARGWAAALAPISLHAEDDGMRAMSQHAVAQLLGE